jgi:O-antigen/teichoic acid export membrane protein
MVNAAFRSNVKYMNSSNNNTSVASSQKIVGNTIYSFISEISLLFTSIFYIVAANYLKDVVYGKFASALAFVGLFTLLVIFGFIYSITKFIVKDRENAGKYIGNALYIQFVFTIICFAFCYLIAFLFRSKYPLDVRYIIIIVFFAEALKCYNLTLRTAYKALNEFRYATIAVLIERISLLLIGSILLIGGYGLYAAALVLLASRILGFVLLVYFSIRMRYRLFLKPDTVLIRDLLKKSWIYVVQTFFGKIFDNIDVVMISLMRKFDEVGWYSAARRILEGLWLIPNIITEAVYPEFAVRHLVSKSLVSKLFDKSYKYMLIVSIIVSVGTVVIASALIDLVYGVDFKNAALVLILMGLAVIPSFLRYLFGTTLIAINLQKSETWISIGRSVFNVAANFILILIYGYIGAVIATVITECISLIPYFIIFKKDGLVHSTQWRFLYKPLFALFVVLPILFLLNSWNKFLLFFIVLSVYVTMIFILKTFDREEIDIFYHFLKVKILKKNVVRDK